VVLLGHCTERATAPESLAAWARVLAAAGYTVSAPVIGCCGMAGIFGHEIANQAMSRALWDMTWAAHAGPAPSAADPASPAPLLVATGFSCRSQAERFAPAPLRHPIHLL
jgi:Fe-S oxidoreductase